MSAREVLRVGEVETPQAGPGEVRVKLAASGVNPSDVKSRQGSTRKIAWPRLIPHSDGAGVIDQVGDGIAKSRMGERVWVWNGQWKRAFGTAAEYIALAGSAGGQAARQSQLRGRRLLGIPAMTAIHAVALAGAGKGTTVLVAGGAGSVGQYAIQFAKARARPCSPPFPRPRRPRPRSEAGADHTIDYKREDVGERVMELTGKRGVDAVIEMDLAANAKLIPFVLRPKGSVIVYGTGAATASLPAYFCLTQLDPRAVFPGLRTRYPRTRTCGRRHRPRARAGQTDQPGGVPTFALADIAAAHEAVERGTIGNVIVTM